MLEEPGIAPKAADIGTDEHGHMNSSSSDDQPESLGRTKRWRKRRAKPNSASTMEGAGDSATAVHHTSGHWEKTAKSDSVAELATAQRQREPRGGLAR